MSGGSWGRRCPLQRTAMIFRLSSSRLGAPIPAFPGTGLKHFLAGFGTGAGAAGAKTPWPPYSEGIALIVFQTTLRANASRTAAQAASRRRAKLSDRLPTGRAAALSHRKSPDRPMCSQPTGEVWVSHSSGTSRPVTNRRGQAARVGTLDRLSGRSTGPALSGSRSPPDP